MDFMKSMCCRYSVLDYKKLLDPAGPVMMLVHHYVIMRTTINFYRYLLCNESQFCLAIDMTYFCIEDSFRGGYLVTGGPVRYKIYESF